MYVSKILSQVRWRVVGKFERFREKRSGKTQFRVSYDVHKYTQCSSYVTWHEKIGLMCTQNLPFFRI